MKNINTIFEDKNIVVADKPSGVLVHPTQAGEKNTLVDFLVEKYPEIKNLDWPDKSRAGIVHRLDKDTSGVIILAKNPEILTKLQAQFKNHEVQKTYQALVLGKLDKGGKVEADITRGSAGLQKVMDFTYSFSKDSRAAITEYKPLEHYKYKKDDLTLVEVKPKTGRMHQIRVHLKHIGFPIIGDQLYNIKPSKRLSKELELNRQFLHAVKLEINDPISGDKLVFESDLSGDLKNILTKLTKTNE